MEKSCQNCQFAENLYRKTSSLVFCGMYDLPKKKTDKPLCFEKKEIDVIHQSERKEQNRQLKISL